MYFLTIFNIYKALICIHSIYVIYSFIKWLGLPLKWFYKEPHRQINNEFLII